MKTLNVKVTFIEEALGLSASNQDVYSQYIASKNPEAPTKNERMAEEIAAIGEDAVAENGMTVFPKDSDGTPIFWDYQIKGFFKDSCGALQRMKDEDLAKESCKLKAYKKVIDGALFVFPRKIRIHVNGEMGTCERPLRAQTAQGERIALASSETVPAGSWMEFQVMCPDQYEKLVKEWFYYGRLRGMSQWRNSGKGRFLYTCKVEDGMPEEVTAEK